MRRSMSVPFSLVALFATQTAIAVAACPPPSVNQNSECVLTGDAVLNDTLWLTSGTHLNCQGHRLMPLASGVLDDPRTVANEFQPSRPELALFVRNAYDVSIQNSVISGFGLGGHLKTGHRGSPQNRPTGRGQDLRLLYRAGGRRGKRFLMGEIGFSCEEEIAFSDPQRWRFGADQREAAMDSPRRWFCFPSKNGFVFGFFLLFIQFDLRPETINIDLLNAFVTDRQPLLWCASSADRT